MAPDPLPASLRDAAPSLLRTLLARGGSHADLFYEATVRHQFTGRQQAARLGRAPHRTQAQDVLNGLGLRAWYDGGMGYTATASLAPDALHAAAEQAAAQIAGEAPRPSNTPEPPSLFTPPPPPPLPPDAPDAVPAQGRQLLLDEACDAALGFNARVHSVRAVYRDSVRRVMVFTSDGAAGADSTWTVSVRVEVTIEASGGSVTAHAIAGGAFGFGHFLLHPPAEAAHAAVERALRRAEARPVRSGACPVVFAPGWGGAWLHETVGHLLEADVLFDPASPFYGRLGRPIAAPAVTLVDDGTVPHGRGTARLDDEGTPTACSPLIEAGTLTHALTDRRHAHRHGLPLTGHARRQDYRTPPHPRMRNLLLRPGPDDPAALVSEVRDGLYVTDIRTGSVDAATGRCTLIVDDGYRIEQGRRTHPITGLRLTGDVRTLLHWIRGIGRDFALETARGTCVKNGEAVGLSVGQPTVLVDGFSVVPVHVF